jgi:enoyl-CoA hydratase/carnithine racemase
MAESTSIAAVARIRTVTWREAVAPKPIIAAVHGYVSGLGVRIALYADLLVAARDAKFQITETPRGCGPSSKRGAPCCRKST